MQFSLHSLDGIVGHLHAVTCQRVDGWERDGIQQQMFHCRTLDRDRKPHVQRQPLYPRCCRPYMLQLPHAYLSHHHPLLSTNTPITEVSITSYIFLPVNPWSSCLRNFPFSIYKQSLSLCTALFFRLDWWNEMYMTTEYCTSLQMATLSISNRKRQDWQEPFNINRINRDTNLATISFCIGR